MPPHHHTCFGGKMGCFAECVDVLSAPRKTGWEHAPPIPTKEASPCRGSQEVYVFLNVLVGEAPTGAYAPVGEHPGNFVKNEGENDQSVRAAGNGAEQPASKAIRLSCGAHKDICVEDDAHHGRRG